MNEPENKRCFFAGTCVSVLNIICMRLVIRASPPNILRMMAKESYYV